MADFVILPDFSELPMHNHCVELASKSIGLIDCATDAQFNKMSKAKNILSFGALVLMLVGLPAISYFYLKQGYEYRKEAILTQGDYGQMPDLKVLPVVRGTLPDTLKGAMTVVGWLDPTKPASVKQYGLMMDSVYQQFEHSPNLYFTTIVKAEDATTTATDFATEYNLPDVEMVSFLEASDQQFRQSAKDFQLPILPGEAPVVALVDSSLTIVKHYDFTKREETIGLVQLISLIIPLPEKADIIVKREKEF
ncbi:MAG: hypothetical protein AAF597_12970 [Bacteroidota bacterium]